MTTISYSVSIQNIEYQPLVQEDISNTRFGNSFKNVSGNLITDNLNKRQLTDGWYRQIPEINLVDNIIEYKDGIVINDKHRINTQLDGLNSIPKKYNFSSSPTFSLLPDTLYASRIPSQASDIGVFIFSNKNNNLEVYRKFQFIDQYTITSLDRFRFTLFLEEGQEYVGLGLQEPISIAEINGSNILFTENDYTNAKADLDQFIIDKGLEEDQFFDLCQYIPREALPIRFWNTSSKDYSNIVLNTEFLPVYKDVSVIAVTSNGPVILTDYSVDCLNGSIKLNSELTEEQFASVIGFYLFYGVLPQIFFSTQSQTILPYTRSSEESISKYSFSSFNEESFTPYISEDNFALIIEEVSQSKQIRYSLPNLGNRLFIEADSNLLINNVFLPKNKPIYLEKQIGSIDFKLPINTIDLLEDFTIEQPLTTLPISSIQNESFAIYGLFDTYGAKRVSMMSGFFNLEDISTETIIGSISTYGSNIYGSGGYGGLSPLLSSSIIYGSGSDTINENPDMDFIVTFSPSEIGNEIILPSWTSKADIVVYIGDTISNKFLDSKHYIFIEPDILVFKDIDPNMKYTIKFKSLVYPVIQNLILQDNTFDVIIRDNVNIKKYYSTLLGLYILSNKDILVRFGTINSVGKKTYFDNQLLINKVVGKKFFEKNVSGLKSFIF